MMNGSHPDVVASRPRRRKGIALVAAAIVVAVAVLGLAITLRDEETDKIDETDGQTTPTSAPLGDVEVLTTPTLVWTIADGYLQAPGGIGSEPVELWRLDARERIDDAAGDHAGVVALERKGPVVLGLEPLTGEEQWRVEDLPGRGYRSSDGDRGDVELLGDDLALVGYRDADEVEWSVFVDRGSGAIRFSLQGVGWYNVAAVGDLVVIGSSDDTYAVDARSGDEVWRRGEGSIVDVGEGQVFVTRGTGRPIDETTIYETSLLDEADGSALWTADGLGDATSIVMNGQLIVAQTEGPSVTSFDATTGDRLWAGRYSPDGTSGRPAADDLVALSGRELRVVDRNGEERWRDAIDASAVTSARVGDRWVLLVETDGHGAVLLDARSGERLGSAQSERVLAVAGGVAYVLVDDTLHGVDLVTMDRRWDLDLGIDGPDPVATFDGGIVFVDDGGTTIVSVGAPGASPSA